MKLSKEDIGRRYANALYDYAQENDQVAEIKNEVDLLIEVISSNHELIPVLSDPFLNLNQKAQILEEIKSKLSQTMQNFLQIISDYRRFADLPEVLAAFNKRFDAANQIDHGTVTTALAMSNDQLANLSAAYAKRENLKEMHFDNIVDPSILGGAIVAAAGKRIDGSIKTKIKQLKNNLVNNM